MERTPTEIWLAALRPYGRLNRPSVQVGPDWDAGGGVMGGRAPDRPPEAPAQRYVNILALALPDRPHHGPRYNIYI